MSDMPAGTIGFRVSGDLTADDLEQTLEPALRTAAKDGSVHMLHLLEDGLHLHPSALERSAESGLSLGIAPGEGWSRWAIVTDVESVRIGIHLIGLLIPGELRLFGKAELDDARLWLSEEAPADASRGLL
jgi:hypothetical protein